MNMKKKIIFLSIFIFLLAIGGVAAFYFTKANQKPIVYGEGEVAKYKTDTRPVPTDGTTPLDHDAYANVAYILWLLEHTNQYSSLTEGTAVSVGQKQTIYNHRRVNGKEQLVDTISSGLVTLGKQKYFKDGKVLIRDYISKNGNDIQWKTEEPECISNSQYIVRYGWLPTQATAYIICKDTILEISDITVLEDGNYSIQLSLNPDRDYAPFWYQREVATNAASLSEAKFSSIKVEYIFDAAWRVLQVNTQEKYTVTPKVAPITVNCDTNITESFTYEKPDFGAALDYFEQYKDLKPSDGEDITPPEENTPLSYITGSLLGGDSKEHFFKIDMKINDRILEGKLSLDISDLNDVSVKVSLGDLQVVYASKEVYIDYHTIKLKCNIEEATIILRPLLEELFYGENPSEITSGFDVNQIMSDINAATMVETEEQVTLNVNLNLMGISLPLVFDIHKSKDELDLISIKANINLSEYALDVNITKQDNITFKPIEGEYNDVSNLDFIIEDATKILKNKKFTLNFAAEYNDFSFEGTAYISTEKDNPIQLNLVISNAEKNILENLSLIYYSNTIYLTYKENKLKLSVSSLLEFLQQQGIVFPELTEEDLHNMLESLASMNIKTILKNLSLKEDGISLELNLSFLEESLSSVLATIKDTDLGFILTTNVYNITLEFDTKNDFEIANGFESYIEVQDYLDIAKYLMELIGKKSIGLTINGSILINSQPAQVSSKLHMYLMNNTYQIDGEIVCNMNGNVINIHVIYVDKMIYIQFFGYTLKLDVTKLSSTLDEIVKTLELPNIEIPSQDFYELIKWITQFKIGENWIEADLNSLTELLGKVFIGFTLDGSILNLEISSEIAKVNVELMEINAHEIEVPTEYYTEKDLLKLVAYVKDIKQILEQKHVHLQGGLTYEKIGIAFDIYVDFKEAIKAKGKLHIQYENESFDMDITYVNSILYISYKNLKLKMDSNRIMEYLPKLELPSMGIDEILSYLKEIRIEDSQLKVIVGKEETIEIIIADTIHGFDIKLDSYEATMQVNVEEEQEIQVEDSAYTNVGGYLDIIDYIMKDLSQTSFGIELNASIELEGKPLAITGQINVYYSNVYSIEGVLHLSYSDLILDITILGMDKDIYIQFLGYTFLLNMDTLPTTLQCILKELGIEGSLNFDFNILDLLYIMDSIIVTDQGLQFDFEKLGRIGISLTKDQDQILLNITTSKITLSSVIKPIAFHEIEVPTEYYTEEDLLKLVAYVKDIKQILEQKHVHLQGGLTYEKIGIAFDIYVDFKEAIKAKGKLHIQYENESFDMDITYVNSILYISYKNLKLKMDSNRIMEYLPKLELPSMGIDEILSYLKEIRIEDSQLKVIVGKEETIEIIIADTIHGFDIKLDSYEATMQVNVEEEQEIQVEDSAYTNVGGYLDIIDYIMKDLSQTSFGIELNASIELEGKPLAITGKVDCLYNGISHDIVATLHLQYATVSLDIEVSFIQNRVYLKLYDNVIELTVADLDDLIQYVLGKLNISINLSNSVLPFINNLLEGCQMTEHSLVLNLSHICSQLSQVKLETSLTEVLHLNLKQENLFEVSLLETIVSNPTLPEYTPTLSKDEIYSIMDDVFYLLDIVASKAVHIELNAGKILVGINEVDCSGYVDILIKDSKVEISGHFTIHGVGILVDIDFVYLKNTLYLTIANQTFCLKLDQLDEFMEQAKQILEPMLSLDITLPKVDLNMNLEILNLFLSANQLEADFTELLGKVCKMSIVYGLSLDAFDFELNGSYDEISFELPMVISKSNLVAISVPTGYLTMEEVLEVLRFIVDGYNLTNQKEFNIQLALSLYANGSLFADIEGDLYLKLFEDNTFDARLKAMVQQYENGLSTHWHQLDLQVISLQTLQALNAGENGAMIYALYGNNPVDTSAVVKIKSTYSGIESLIETITKLMNIQLPAFDLESASEFDIRNLFNLITVKEDQLCIQIHTNAIFEEIQHEVMEFTLTRQNGTISNVEAKNIYLSYTNSKKHFKLDTLSLSLVPHKLDVYIPNDLDSYYDISNISNLFEAFYNNALEKNFEISGTVTLTALNIININMPIQLKINVDDKGMPILYAHLDMSNLGLGSLLMSKKHVYIYYKDEYVYIHRDDSKDKDDRKIKIHYTEFLNNIMYYLMDYSMGLPDSILSLINKTPEGDGFVDASGCINNLQIGTNEFMFDINMKELADNYDLGKLVMSLASTLVAKTDDLGNYILDAEGNVLYAPMIYQIPNFEFTAVDVINLNSKNLVLSNIKEDANGNLIVHKVDLSELDAYILDFNANFNVDEEYIYSNGSWISNGKLKHNVVFDLDEAGSIVKQYSEASKIDFPYEIKDIISVSSETGTRYFKLLGWYYDASYKKPLDHTSSIVMENKSLSYYAKVVDVTINLHISSVFHEDYLLTTYEGADISIAIEEKYNIAMDGLDIYKYIGLQNANGMPIDISALTRGSYTLVAQWEKVEYSFYAIYNDTETQLEESSDLPFLEEDFVIQKNNEYLIYSHNRLTPKYMVSSFANLFILNEDLQRFELHLLSLNDILFKDFDQITFEASRDEFNTKGYYGFFIPKATTKDISGLMPNGTYDSFEINAWVSEDVYYSLSDLKEIRGPHQFKAYIATKLSFFDFDTEASGAALSKYTGAASLVILPEYALVGGSYLPVVGIKEQLDENKLKGSAFTSNTSIETIVLNESMAFIGSNAFKNCDGLKNVYLPKKLLSLNVASDAFYFEKSGAFNFEKTLELVKKISFHCSELQANELNLVACKYNNSDRHYGKKESGFLGVGTADLRNAFLKEDVVIANVSYELIKNY